MIWLISDTHFFHKRIGELTGRVEGWQEIIVTAWRDRVADDDWVLHLGDFALCKKEMALELCQSLPGRKILVFGNHDKGRKRFKDIGFEHTLKYPEYLVIEDEEMGKVAIVVVEDRADFCWEEGCDHVLYVSHVPVEGSTKRRDPWGPYLHGHKHNDWPAFSSNTDGMNMCVEVNSYRPWALPEVLERIENSKL